MSPRSRSPRRSHLVRSRRLQRTRAWMPAHRSPATSLQRTRAWTPAYMCAASCAGDAPLLARRRRQASGPSMPSSSRPPRRGALTSQSWSRPAPMMQRMQGRGWFSSKASCLLYFMYTPLPILDLLLQFLLDFACSPLPLPDLVLPILDCFIAIGGLSKFGSAGTS
jgi:hypothetical protein